MANMAASLLGSSSLSVAAKLFQRIVGFVSLLILARLLTPSDFAVAALTSIVIYFFDVLSNVGSEQYIIQKKAVSNADLNTAWTLDILVKSALFALLSIVAPFVASWYDNPDLTLAIIVASCVLPINALKNPGLIVLKKELDYNVVFKLSVLQKIISFVTVILIAYFYRSYWAMIIGDIISALVMTIGSYWLDHRRPRLSVLNFRVQWVFSRWMVVKGIVGYARSQADTFLVSLIYPQAMLGQYHVSRNIVMLPSHNLMMPAIEPLLAAYSKNLDDRSSLEFQVRVSLLLVAMIITPIVVFMWLFPRPIVDTLLGTQWTESYQIVSHLSLIAYYLPFLLVLEQLLIACNKVKTAFLFDLFSLIVVVSGLLALRNESISNFALARGILGCGATLLLGVYLSRIYRLAPVKMIIGAVGSFLLAMLSAKLAGFLPISEYGSIIRLLGYGSSFVTSYAIFIFIALTLCKSVSEEAAYLERTVIKIINKAWRLIASPK
ncbi:hypothetical protein BTA51_10430 [Hahella sp. CCB-MM4]|uniref:oligosaccharide flippase family protein n=1 Tax=Hahella sp. (strain CCB-MM4) TaxID=1926491 RepID=UPI000B9C0147|nr:oligosaccharide flippase family protein [Hahella sp. CCB-MM4]OZG73433.1 hypothetical protein BTA51_10430 [Hahella sp. CCB-MM4]